MAKNKSKLLIAHVFLIAYMFLMANCDLSWTNEKSSYNPADNRYVRGGSAFLALRSCHQVMRGESGEFFSPDYLCSNPPLWCNWTIQVDPGKRVHVHLEDLTPPDACHSKMDRIYMDEPMGVAGAHSILEKCWSQFDYMSLSSTLYVVQLIRGNPSPPHRGFYGHYKATEPPVTYFANGESNKEDTEMMAKSRIIKQTSPVPISFTKFSPMPEGDSLEAILFLQPTPPAQAKPEVLLDYFNHISSSFVSNELPPEEPVVEQKASTYSLGEEEDRNRDTSEVTEETESKIDDQSTEDWKVNNFGSNLMGLDSDLLLSPTTPVVVTNQGTSSPVRMTTQTPSKQQPSNLYPKAFSQNSSAIRRNVDAQSQEFPKLQVPTTVPGNNELLNISTDESTATSYTNSPIEPQDPFDNSSKMVGPFTKKKHEKVRDHSEAPHLPGDPLFEVAVEVTLNMIEENWQGVAKTLLISIKSAMSQQLKMVYTDVLSCKRIKRLNAGLLYIFWLHIGDGLKGMKSHWSPHQVLQKLLKREVSHRNSTAQSFIISISTADVNECLTQLMLCDINAKCLNRFGSYECHCRPGYKDLSRLGSGGTICVDTTGYTSAPMADMIIGIYMACFLLSFLILLLCVFGVLYLRHHRGAFVVSCWRNSLPPIPPPDYKNNNDCNDNSSINTHSELPPPPPPPIRRPTEGWVHPEDCCPSVDLPLLRFSPLKPLDGYNKPEVAASDGY
ncbi:hypothetical protein DPEC_G00176740 [Dallia pectoralis]|uniref:Uncharacterized protein n=1 Tax=Dallia pectoralis TaxID=75939 RepID=A0ACC2GEY3_DALPE|nr:hypothetical protein DPEC_G00176740 [Dallia pectoralis]